MSSVSPDVSRGKRACTECSEVSHHPKSIGWHVSPLDFARGCSMCNLFCTPAPAKIRFYPAVVTRKNLQYVHSTTQRSKQTQTQARSRKKHTPLTSSSESVRLPTLSRLVCSTKSNRRLTESNDPLPITQSNTQRGLLKL